MSLNNRLQTKRYCFDFIRTGLDLLLNKGIKYFGADDVPLMDSPTNKAIIGTSIYHLRYNGIIQECNFSLPEFNIKAGMRPSKRKASNGRKIKVYCIASESIARKFLEYNKVEKILDNPFDNPQTNLFNEGANNGESGKERA